MVVAVKCLQCLYKEEREFFGRKCDMLMWWKDWEERERGCMCIDSRSHPCKFIFYATIIVGPKR